MDFKEVVKKRASLRKFSSKKPVDVNIIEILETANTAPSPGNLPILRYLMVEDYKTIEKIAEACQQDFIKKAPVVVLVCSESKQIELMYDKRAKNYIKQHAGAAIENLLLEITNRNMACCWVGAFSEVVLRNLLNIPGKAEIEAVLPIGYPSITDHTKQKRKPRLQGRVFFEMYGNTSKRGMIRIKED